MNQGKQLFNLRPALLLGTVTVLLLLQIMALLPGVTTPFERIEYSVRDMLMRLRGVQHPSSEIVIIAIDDFSFNWTGYQWPWPRSYFAEIVDQVNAGGGRIVGVDILLFEPDKEPANDQAFADALGKAPSAVSVIQIFESPVEEFKVSTLLQPLTPYQQTLDATGVTGFARDEDAIVRSVQAYDSYNNKIYYNWAFQIASQYLGVEPPTNLTSTSLQFNGQTVRMRGGQILVNFSGPAGTWTTRLPYPRL